MSCSLVIVSDQGGFLSFSATQTDSFASTIGLQCALSTTADTINVILASLESETMELVYRKVAPGITFILNAPKDTDIDLEQLLCLFSFSLGSKLPFSSFSSLSPSVSVALGISKSEDFISQIPFHYVNVALLNSSLYTLLKKELNDWKCASIWYKSTLLMTSPSWWDVSVPDMMALSVLLKTFSPARERIIPVYLHPYDTKSFLVTVSLDPLGEFQLCLLREELPKDYLRKLATSSIIASCVKELCTKGVHNILPIIPDSVKVFGYVCMLNSTLMVYDTELKPPINEETNPENFSRFRSYSLSPTFKKSKPKLDILSELLTYLTLPMGPALAAGAFSVPNCMILDDVVIVRDHSMKLILKGDRLTEGIARDLLSQINKEFFSRFQDVKIVPK